MTTSFLVKINTIFVLLPLLPALVGPRDQGLAFWLVVASVAATNGVFHLYATIRMRRYSPGLVTGILLYVPLAVLGYRWFVATGRLHAGTAIQALLIGPAYLFFSGWSHRRRAARMNS